jgi:hypothetical protein
MQTLERMGSSAWRFHFDASPHTLPAISCNQAAATCRGTINIPASSSTPSLSLSHFHTSLLSDALPSFSTGCEYRNFLHGPSNATDPKGWRWRPCNYKPQRELPRVCPVFCRRNHHHVTQSALLTALLWAGPPCAQLCRCTSGSAAPTSRKSAVPRQPSRQRTCRMGPTCK